MSLTLIFQLRYGDPPFSRTSLTPSLNRGKGDPEETSCGVDGAPQGTCYSGCTDAIAWETDEGPGASS